MLDIEDAYVAYCLDEAISIFGTTVQAELDKCEGKTRKSIEGKQAIVLRKMVGDDKQKPQFRTPKPTLIRKEGGEIVKADG